MDGPDIHGVATKSSRHGGIRKGIRRGHRRGSDVSNDRRGRDRPEGAGGGNRRRLGSDGANLRREALGEAGAAVTFTVGRERCLGRFRKIDVGE